MCYYRIYRKSSKYLTIYIYNIVIDLSIVIAAKAYKPITKSPSFESDNHGKYILSLQTTDG